CACSNSNRWLRWLHPFASFRDKGIVQGDFVHRARPNQQRIRRIGGALITVAAAFDDQAKIVLSREVYGGDNVFGLRRGKSVEAGCRGPRIHPAGGLSETWLVTNVVG